MARRAPVLGIGSSWRTSVPLVMSVASLAVEAEGNHRRGPRV